MNNLVISLLEAKSKNTAFSTAYFGKVFILKLKIKNNNVCSVICKFVICILKKKMLSILIGKCTKPMTM